MKLRCAQRLKLIDFSARRISSDCSWPEMPQLDGLPPELLAHLALFLGDTDSRMGSWADALTKSLRDLLNLRCASKACEGAVRRAAKNHACAKEFSFGDSKSAECIAACGRVFGAGCRELYHDHVDSAEVAVALRQFVVATQGRLEELDIGSTSHISTATLMQMCRACPLLKRIDAYNFLLSSSAPMRLATVDSFAAELSRTCPLLEDVALGHIANQLGPAEAYQMHFPNLKCLVFQPRFESGDLEDYEPTEYARIEATAMACTRATVVDFSNCTVSPALVELLLRTPLKGRVWKLVFDWHTVVAPETILQCAAGFDALRSLRLPARFDAPPDFYASLVRARPRLAHIHMGFGSRATDECLRILVESLALESIILSSCNDMSPSINQIIAESSSSLTLRSLDIFDCARWFTSTHMLWLVRGCPRLSTLSWDRMNLSPIKDGSNVDEINALLKARGAKYDQITFQSYGPEPLRYDLYY